MRRARREWFCDRFFSGISSRGFARPFGIFDSELSDAERVVILVAFAKRPVLSLDKIVLIYAQRVTKKSAANIRQDGRTKLSSHWLSHPMPNARSGTERELLSQAHFQRRN